MYPILISVGTINVRANTIFFILGCIAGLYVGQKEVIRQISEKKLIFQPKKIWLFFIIFLPFVYLSGMLNAWIMNWDFLLQNPNWRSFAFSGWISYGGIFGALLFGWLYPLVTKDDSVGTLDIIAIVLPIFEGIYRIGCLLNGCCYGKETNNFGGLYLPNESGIWAVRYPTQILYIILGFGLFLFLWFSRKKKKYEGEFAFKYLFFYGIGRFLIDPLRAGIEKIGILSIYQILDLLLVFIAIIFWVIVKAKKKKGDN